MSSFELQKGSYLGSGDQLGVQNPTWPFFDSEGTEQTTDEFWEVDGFGLNTVAYSISTLGGRLGIPPRRGGNVPLGDRPGQRWIPKPPEQKTRTLAMWVVGMNTDGTIPDDQHMTFQANYRKLRQVFGVYDRELQITRRLRLPPPDDEIVLYASADCIGELEPTMQGPNRGSFTVDLLFADPYWYSGEKLFTTGLTEFSGNGMSWPCTPPYGFGGLSTNPLFIDVGGDSVAWPKVTFVGPVQNPAIENVTRGEYMRWDSNLSFGEELVIDMKEKTVMVGTTSRWPSIARRASTWVGLTPGMTNTLRFHAASPDPQAMMKVSVREAWY